MSLADSVDEGDLSPYDLFDDWQAVEEHQRRRAREDRFALDELATDHTLLEMKHYLALEALKVVVELLKGYEEQVGRLTRELEYEAFIANREFWATVGR